MLRPRPERLLVFLAALGVAATLAAPASAAFPRLLMVSGKSLDEPVLISDWVEVAKLYHSLVFDGEAVDRSRLDGRPSLRISLFWDNTLWEPYVRDNRLDELRPEQANQFGRFYPAAGGRLPLVDLPGVGEWPKIVRGEALEILDRHGVPMTVADDRRPEWPAILVGAGALALATALIVSLGLKRRRERASSRASRTTVLSAQSQ